jgi:hypothetical protein
MSIRGSVVLECDSTGCHAEQVIGDLEMADDLVALPRGGVEVTVYAPEWVLDDDGLLHCPQCCEEGREKGDDDGVEYGHPADAKADRL